MLYRLFATLQQNSGRQTRERQREHCKRHRRVVTSGEYRRSWCSSDKLSCCCSFWRQSYYICAVYSYWWTSAWNCACVCNKQTTALGVL